MSFVELYVAGSLEPVKFVRISAHFACVNCGGFVARASGHDVALSKQSFGRTRSRRGGEARTLGQG